MTSCQHICGVVAAFYGVDLKHMLSHRRRDVRVRQVAMYMCYDLTRHSYPSLGRIFNRDHTTILHATRKIEAAMAADPEFAAEIKQIEAAVRASDLREGRIHAVYLGQAAKSVPV